MPLPTPDTRWHRVADGLDVELQQGIPTQLSKSNDSDTFAGEQIAEQVYQLTGLAISINNWIQVTSGEQVSSICINKTQFKQVLDKLALASAALYVDRFHKAIDLSAVDWDNAQYTYDFNQAVERCCIPWGTLNKDNYYPDYIRAMHAESERLITEGISPLVEPE